MATLITIGNGKAYSGAGGATIIAGDGDTITLSGGYDIVSAHDSDTITISGGNSLVTVHDNATVALAGGNDIVLAHDQDTIAITGGGNSVWLHDAGSLTVNDARSAADGFVGSVNFGDTVVAHNNDTVSLNYSLTLGSSDVATVGFQPNVTGGSGDRINANFAVTAGAHDTITFAGSNQVVSLTAGSADTILTTGGNDTITIGGGVAGKNAITVGATGSGTIFNGGLGVDTFTAGSGYTGGNQFLGSARGYQDGFVGIGNCVNYAPLLCRVTADLNNNIGQGFDAAGNLLWTDTYGNMQQAKAGLLDGNQLIGSNSYYCELKGSLGSTIFYDGAAGDRIIWSSAGATALLDGKSTDVAYAGAGNDELYWRNSPGGKGVSNFGETIYGFNTAQGDDLNMSEFVDSGFAGVANPFTGTSSSLFTFVDVSLAANGSDTDVWFDKTGSGNFTQLAAVLKNQNLFSAFGVTDISHTGAQQVVQDMYNTGHLVLLQPH